MPNRPAVREEDDTEHKDPTPQGQGSTDVSINFHFAWLQGDSIHDCKQHAKEAVVNGADRVLINHRRAVGQFDYLLGGGPPNRIEMGSPNVLVGVPDVGMMSDANRDAFCKDLCALKKDWPSLTPDERRDRYQQLLDSVFDRMGAPRPELETTLDPSGSTLGSWNSREWKMNLRQGTFDAPTMDPQLGKITFHESRHAEQGFLGLRSRAATRPRVPGRNLRGYELDVPGRVREDVLDAAANNPLDRDSAEGRWARPYEWTNWTPAGRENHGRVMKELAAAKKVIKNRRDRGETPTQEEVDRQRAAYQAYQALPGEFDSFETMGAGDCGGCP